MVDTREMTSTGEQLFPHLELWLGSGPSGSLPIPTWFPSHPRVGGLFWTLDNSILVSVSLLRVDPGKPNI